VANALLFDIVANVAAIPASPSNQDAVEVTNGTGIESFTPLSGVPSGFVGDSGLSVRLIYDGPNSTWVWLQYFPNDPENRYGDAIVTLQGDVSDLQTDLGIAQTDILGLDSSKLDATTAASTYQAQAGMSSYLTTSDAASTYQTQAGMSSYVATSDIGVTVQGYDADTAKLDVAQTFTAVQTLTDPAIIGTILEDVYTITDGAAFEVDPGNGSVQLITLGANRTPKATNFAAGEAVTLMVDDGSARTLTWTDATWGSGGVKWTGGSAPTLATSGYTVLQFWKVGTQVYGALVGEVA
jgi:hypothetical protein